MCVYVHAFADSDSDLDPDTDSHVEPFAVSSSDSAQTMASSYRASGAVPRRAETQMVSLDECQFEGSESEEVEFLGSESVRIARRPCQSEASF